jgi:protein-arginine kinase activator protein McsA
VTYSNKDPVEITLGVCEQCSAYVPFIRLITGNETSRVYQCLTCKANHTQYMNGKVVFNYLEDAYTIKRN